MPVKTNDRLAASLVQRIETQATEPITTEEQELLCSSTHHTISEEIVNALYEAAKPTRPAEFIDFLERFSTWVTRRKEEAATNTHDVRIR